MKGIIEMLGRFTARCDGCGEMFSKPADTWSIGQDGVCVKCSRVTLTLMGNEEYSQAELNEMYDNGTLSNEEYHRKSIIIEERV